MLKFPPKSSFEFSDAIKMIRSLKTFQKSLLVHLASAQFFVEKGLKALEMSAVALDDLESVVRSEEKRRERLPPHGLGKH
jgi:hypothetical protein